MTNVEPLWVQVAHRAKLPLSRVVVWRDQPTSVAQREVVAAITVKYGRRAAVWADSVFQCPELAAPLPLCPAEFYPRLGTRRRRTTEPVIHVRSPVAAPLPPAPHTAPVATSAADASGGAPLPPPPPYTLQDPQS